MIPKPIGPKAHGAIDHGFVTLQLLAPTLFGMRGVARALCYFFGGFQGVVNVLTDHPLSLRRLIPFRVHGQLETPFVPALLLLPWLTGALKQRGARRFFLPFFGIALANYLLTDYLAHERPPATAGQRRASSGGPTRLARVHA